MPEIDFRHMPNGRDPARTFAIVQADCGTGQRPSSNSRLPNSTTWELEVGSWAVLFVQRECVQRVAYGDEHVLLPVERVGFRRVRRRSDARMPQRIAGGGVVGNEVAAAVAREEHLPCRGEDAAAPAARGKFVPPRHLAGLV